MCILVPASFLLIFCGGADFFGAIKFGAKLTSKFKKKYAETAPSNGGIWDEFCEQL